MQIFLEEVAKQLINDYSDNLGDHCLVFPNRRSALFFRRYLALELDKPLWAPEIRTINEIFRKDSDLDIAESLKLIFELYESYKSLIKGAEPFDEFYFWGEMLVNDFDDIDKYRVDPSVIFQNLHDLREIDEKFGSLDPDIVAIIRKFWSGFDPAKLTSEKSDFLSVWEILSRLYNDFRARLRNEGLAYEGMIMRDMIDDLEDGGDYWPGTKKTYHFIGFNALNRCEKDLLVYLKKLKKARFYWDYDRLYSDDDNHEAGYFIRENLKILGQDLNEKSGFSYLKNSDPAKRDWIVYSAPSDVAQAKLIPGIIEQLGNITSDPFNTAIVLADENMLMPVLNSLPLSVTDINITMGYPLHQTPVYSLVNRLLSLQKRRREEGNLITFYYGDVLKILKHQYTAYLFRDDCDKVVSMIRDQNLVRVPADDLMVNEFFSKLFIAADDHISLNRYIGSVLLEVISSMAITDSDEETGSGRLSLQQEYLYILIKSINQLDTLFDTSGLTPGKDIYSRVIEKLMRNINVPFSGEPLCGLQVMGILETRVLDFENIIFISVNEGILPKGSPGNSYIPYNLRMAFGLPTIKHQDSIYAYYFYRLLQRSKKIRFLYNSGSGGLKSGEMSRFLLQLKYSEKLKPQFAESRFMIIPHERVPEQIKRTVIIQELLEKKYIQPGAYGSLSPSALNTWNSCSMRFYYRYIAGLKEADDVQAEVDSPLFGNILHHAMKNLYGGFGRTIITGDVIESMINNADKINSAVEGAFREIMMNRRPGKIGGRNLIIVSVISDLVKQIMRVDSRLSPIEIVSLEEKYKTGITIERGNKKYTISLEGTIDRVDSIDGVIRILDYKSGKDNLYIRSVDDLFEENGKYKNSAAFQTLVYCFIYLRNNPGVKLRPSLYPVRLIFDNNFSDIFNIKNGIGAGSLDDFGKINDHFVSCLTGIISDIFDPERDFEMTSETSVCKYCSYNKLCDRQDVK